MTLRGYSFFDILSRINIKIQFWISGFFGTVFLLLKSFFFGIYVGNKTRCFGSIHLLRAPKSKIFIGNNVIIVSSTFRSSASSIFAPTKIQTFSESACVKIGNNVGLNGTSIAARSKLIEIGNGTMIAPNVAIMDSDFHATWPPHDRIVNPGIENDADVIIGENVWIGSRCLVLKGVVIGKNTVVAAGSVVVNSLDSNILAGGIPAKKIRSLV